MTLKETKHNHKNGNFISYEDSKKWVEENELTKNIKTEYEWKLVTYKLPYFIPKDPQQHYNKKGTWKGWGDFLGTGNKVFGDFLKYEESKKWVNENLPNIKSQSEWRVYVHNHAMIDSRNYSGDFTDKPDYFKTANIISKNKKLKFPVSYTIDIGILQDSNEEGENVVIEYNDMWAIGNYGMPNDLYLQLLKDRYFEIVE